MSSKWTFWKYLFSVIFTIVPITVTPGTLFCSGYLPTYTVCMWLCVNFQGLKQYSVNLTHEAPYFIRKICQAISLQPQKSKSWSLLHKGDEKTIEGIHIPCKLTQIRLWVNPLIQKHFPTHQYHSFTSIFPLTNKKIILNHKLVSSYDLTTQKNPLWLFFFSISICCWLPYYIYAVVVFS